MRSLMHWRQTDVKKENVILKHFTVFKRFFKNVPTVLWGMSWLPHGSLENLLIKLSETSFIEGACLRPMNMQFKALSPNLCYRFFWYRAGKADSNQVLLLCMPWLKQHSLLVWLYKETQRLGHEKQGKLRWTVHISHGEETTVTYFRVSLQTGSRTIQIGL